MLSLLSDRSRFNADGTGAGAGVGDQVVDSPRHARTSSSGPHFSTTRPEELHAVFVAFNEFGGTSDVNHMDGKVFAKLARECRLLSGAWFVFFHCPALPSCFPDATCFVFPRVSPPSEVDLIFTKCKSRGSRKVSFDQFQNALGMIGVKKLPSVDPQRAFESVVDAVVTQGGPMANSATVPETDGVYGKLTGDAASDPRAGAGAGGHPASPRTSVGRRTASGRDVSRSIDGDDDAGGADDGVDPRLRDCFRSFAVYGGGSDSSSMDGVSFSKLCK